MVKICCGFEYANVCCGIYLCVSSCFSYIAWLCGFGFVLRSIFIFLAMMIDLGLTKFEDRWFWWSFCQIATQALLWLPFVNKQSRLNIIWAYFCLASQWIFIVSFGWLQNIWFIYIHLLTFFGLSFLYLLRSIVMYTARSVYFLCLMLDLSVCEVYKIY